MTDPKPTRFRFSLRFLLAWVLLTSTMLGLSLEFTKRSQHSWPAEHPSDMMGFTYNYAYGWPAAAFEDENTFNSEVRDGHHISTNRVTHVRGLLIDVLFWMTFSFGFGLLVRTVLRELREAERENRPAVDKP